MRTRLTPFIIMIIIAFFAIMYFFTEHKEFSEKENRMMAVFPGISIGNFINGSFQEQLENALKDQMFQREVMIESTNTIKGLSKKHINFVFDMLKGKKLLNGLEASNDNITATTTESVAIDTETLTTESETLETSSEPSQSDIPTSTPVSGQTSDTSATIVSDITPSPVDTIMPTSSPTTTPTNDPTAYPTAKPTLNPTADPTFTPVPTVSPSPTQAPTPTNIPIFNYRLDPIGNSYKVAGTDLLTLYPFLENSSYKTAIRQKTNQFKEMVKRHPNLKIYTYFITKTEDLNWFDKSEGIKSFDYAAYIKSNLPQEVQFSKMQYSNLDDLLTWSYKTDHHWNHKGAHKGYTDIYNMLSKDLQLSKMKEPVSGLDFGNLQWVGSNGGKAGVKVVPDVFQAYEYDLGTYEAYVGTQKKEVGLLQQYKSGIINRGLNVNQYGVFYGGEETGNIVKYVFKGNEKNLMLICDSNNKPMRRVLASHFNTTIIVDYCMIKNVKFDTLIKNYNIDVVVISAQNRYWTDENIYRINGGVKYLFTDYPTISD